MLIKEFSIRIKKETKEGNFHIITTIIFSLLMAIFVAILVIFIQDRYKKIVAYEDMYLPLYYSLSPPSPSSPPCKSSSFSSSHLISTQANTSSRTRVITSDFEDFRHPKDLWHSMSDEELVWRASMVPQILEFPFNRTPKVAFMFLARGRLPLAPLWEMFFKGHEGLFSIYLHTSPEYTYEPPNSSVFYKRRVPSKGVEWGRATMIDAERRLLANALLDFSNERFILLSESCIPLFNFTTIYNYLIDSNLSFLSSFDDPRRIGRGRYNKRMFPAITVADWRKGSQWFEVNRRLAVQIVSDVKYYPIFRDLCMPPCYMDEHYLPTLVNKVCPELSSNATVTWTDWSAGGPHPTTFVRRDVSEGFLDRVRFGFNCTYNGRRSSVCFLFGRKFHPNTLQPLLDLAPKLFGFNN